MEENLFQMQGKLGSAGFHIKRAPLAWKLGKTRLPGRPRAKEVISFKSFPVQSTVGFHSQGSIAVQEEGKTRKSGSSQ